MFFIEMYVHLLQIKIYYCKTSEQEFDDKIETYFTCSFIYLGMQYFEQYFKKTFSSNWH
jgi:hypothetical protein